MTKEKKLNLVSRVDEIARLESFVDELQKDSELDESKKNDVLLVLNEAVMNAIVHGNQNDPKKHVMVMAYLNSQKMTFRIKDEGPGFDPSELPDPLDPANLLKLGGRGVFLINQYADEVHYSEKGNEVEIVIYI
ncbi:MAG TPA: ATP-binding protein [Balneolales bacterium]|nr:ATP-binding protein [Balneolales bacterium]